MNNYVTNQETGMTISTSSKALWNYKKLNAKSKLNKREKNKQNSLMSYWTKLVIDQIFSIIREF